MASPRPTSSGSSRPRIWLLLAAVAVVALTVGIAVLTATEAPSQTAAELSRPVEIVGDPLPAHNRELPTDPAVGTSAPVVTGEDFDGAPVAIRPQPGRIQVLAFMAAWCPGCQQELPHIVDWVEGGGVPDSVDVVLVSTLHDERRPNWPPQEWLADEGYTGAVLVDDVDSAVAQAFGLSGTPFWVAIDEHGEVLLRTAGVFTSEDLDALGATLAGGNS